jgi:hypothetical protein
MPEAALSKAVKTDLATPKPNRRKHIAVRFAILVVAVSALCAAYWFTRPPELVWWTSPPIGNTRKRLTIRIPYSWDVVPNRLGPTFAQGPPYYVLLRYKDHVPRFVRLVFPRHLELTGLGVTIDPRDPRLAIQDWMTSEASIKDSVGECSAKRELLLGDGTFMVMVWYARANRPAFMRTYRQICNSLRIE